MDDGVAVEMTRECIAVMYFGECPGSRVVAKFHSQDRTDEGKGNAIKLSQICASVINAFRSRDISLSVFVWILVGFWEQILIRCKH